MKFNNKEYHIKVWNNEQLSGLCAFDCETEMITHESIIPELITLQIYDGSDTVYFIEPDRIAEFFDLHQNTKFIAHNAKFDMSVLQAFIGSKGLYQLYDECRVIDTAILFRLLHLATVGHLNTRYGLDYCVKRMLNIDLPKDEEIRTTFAQFKGKSPLEIPKAHLEYAAKDAVSTLKLYLQLVPEIKAVDKMNTMLSHDIQVKGDWALGCMVRNGIGFDLARKEEWLKEQDETLLNLQRRLANYGWVRGQKGVNQRFEEILDWLGIKDKLPTTTTGSVSSKTEDLKNFRHLPFIDDYLSFNELEKATSFVRNLEHNRIHPRFTLLLNTGRVSMSKPNLMQLPRKGNIRDMFIPERGKEFYIIDYSGMENAMLAQVLLKKYGESVMADTINEGRDLHRYYASILFNKNEKKVTKEERQQAKAAVFGIPGGLGIDTFMQFARGYGLDLKPHQAQEMKDKYFEAFPEMRRYLRDAKEGMVYTLTGRARGNTSYCAVANTPFQGLGSDMAKLALYKLTKAGFKIVNFIHDECILEQDISMDRYEEACSLMVEAGRKVAPDLKIEVEGGRAPRWIKM